MALHMDYQATLGGAFTELDLTASRVVIQNVKFSDSHPSVLEFDILQAQHTFPVGMRDYVRLWDDAGTTPDAVAQSSSNPLFEGFVWECEPVESNRIHYVAYDPSQLSGTEIAVMSVPWDASVGGDPPEPGTGATPRLIMNSTIDNDADYAYSRGDGYNVAGMMQLILDDALEPLRWYQAAPAAAVAYTAADMSGFTFVPQEKFVFTNESIRSSLERLTSQNYPEYAFLWEPGARKWRWYSRFNGTPITLTLNDPDATNTVLSMELHRSLDGRYPAVKFYGPQTSTVEQFSTLDGSLSITSTPIVLETATDTNGSFEVQAHTQFQIADSDKRRGAKRLPGTQLVRADQYHWVPTQSPYFEMTFDSGATWQAVGSVWFDFQNGVVQIADGLYPYFWSNQQLQAGSTQQFWVPNGYRLTWAYYSDPITVRRPASGFSGTSNSVAGSTTEKKIYDEHLAVGYSRTGTPVTTASRVTQFQLLGDAILAAVKDIAYAGGCVIEGLQYDFCRLGRIINLAAVDEDGGTVTTGWEAINAVVSDVEYNFAEKTTTLTFSQDALLEMGDNIDLLKERLRIGYVQKIRDIRFQYLYRWTESKFSLRNAGHFEIGGVVYTDTDLYYDPNLGTIEGAL